MGNKNSKNLVDIKKTEESDYLNLDILKKNKNYNNFYKFYLKNKNIFNYNFFETFNKYVIIKTKSIFLNEKNNFDFFKEKKYLLIKYDKNRNPQESITTVSYNDLFAYNFFKDFNITFCSLKGSNFNENYNKSDIFIFKSFNLKILILGEGHGPFGHLISNLIVHLLFKNFIESFTLNENVKMSLKLSFKSTQKKLINFFKNSNWGFDIILSGFVGQVAIIKNNILYWAGVGKNFSTLYSNNQKNIFNFHFNFNHSSINNKEKERIYQNGGEIKGTKIYVKGKEYPDIPHTRCLGNVIAQMIGAYYVPDIIIKSFEPFVSNDNLLILGNNEISYFLNEENVKEIYSLTPDLNLNKIKVLILNNISNFYKKNKIIIRDICFIIVKLNLKNKIN